MANAAYLLQNKIWCFPGVGHLHTVLSPTVGLYKPPRTTMGHLQLFQNKMTNARGVDGHAWN